MYPRGHRGYAAALLLLALVLSAVAFLPQPAQAQTNQITGLISDCSTGLPVNLANVILTDANGVNAPVTVTTSGAGTYAFTPPAASYTISVTAPGYYAGGITAPFRFDGSATVAKDVCVYAHGGTSKVLDLTITSASGAVGGAAIKVYINSNPTGKVQFVTNTTSNVTTGLANVTLWTPGVFEVRVFATGYQPSITSVDMSSTSTTTVTMTAGVLVAGWARDSSNRFISTAVSAALYNPSANTSSGLKVITGQVTGSFYSINAPAGTYRLIVDANGYEANETTVVVSGTPTTVFQNATLQTAPKELYQTTVLFGTRDWNNLTVYRNLTLNPDGTLPGLGPANVRDLRLQINYTLGNGQSTGSVSTGDYNAFVQWVLNNGPLYTTTDNFFLTNGRAYISSASSYAVTVSNSLMTAGEPVWINTTATYTLKSTPPWIPFGSKTYYVNVTTFGDTNTTQYQNQTYIVQLPQTYEMVSNTIIPAGSITTTNYTRILVDPGLSSTTPQIRMVINPSQGVLVAKAQVTGPAGKFYVVNSNYTTYQAFVANNSMIDYSAATSVNPPSNDATHANYTWRFFSGVPGQENLPQNIRYGVTPAFEYNTTGQYTVNVTMVGAGGNVSYRNLTLWVAGGPPTGNFVTNLTGSASAVGQTLHVNQGTNVRFDGSLSTDLAYPGKNGVILNSGYAWDFNGDGITDATGRVVNWTFSKAGQFTVNLTVTDAVGWKGTNVSMTVIVNDTQAPNPAFVVQDPTNDYAPVALTGLMELRNYTFNASSTTDNYNTPYQLNYTWIVAGPLMQRTGTSNKFYGMNVTWGWRQWNLSYAVVLSVKDTGFGSGKPNTGNLTTNISVAIDWNLHPDLYINANTMKVSNTNPESGQTITITVNVTNKPSRAAANNVIVTVVEISASGAVTSLSPSVTWLSSSGSVLTSHTIASGSTVTLQIQVTVVNQGNMTLKVTAYDTNEPYTAVTSENSAQTAILVNQPAWVNYAIIGSVVGVFAVIIFAMYYRRKVKAGDWEPVKLRRGKGEKEEGGKEKPKKEREAKEEKKRL